VPNYYINPQNLANFQIFQEDFDSLTPYYSGHSTKWNIFKQVLSPGDTNSFYGAASIFTTAGQADNWLEFGPITVPANGATLKWKHLYYLNNKRDGYEVLLSTTGLTRDHYISPPVFSRLDNDPKTDGNTSWTPQEINIPPNIYGNSDIYIAFHHFAYNMYYLFIDDIELISCSGLPVVCDFKADTTNILPGNSVNFTDLSSGNPILWEWTFYGGTPSYSLEQNPQNIKYSSPGVYPVKLKVFNGENYDSITKTNYINVNANDIENYQEFSNIKISPNPAKDYVKVSFPTLMDDAFLMLFDMHGRKIYELLLKKGSHEQTIALNNLKNGYYIIKLINNLNCNFGLNKLIILK
jgi:PKD repeat protein